MKCFYLFLSVAACAVCLGAFPYAALAQTPRISALFPAGAKTGESVDVAVRGGNLIGAKRVVVIGAGGVSAELVGGNVTVDESARPVFQAKCTVCHEARSPANRTLTPEQWASTVDRMINQRSAPITKEERDRIVPYLQALSRAGQVVAKVRVAPDAAPGMREVRIITDRGASTAWPFEVGKLPEMTAAEPNSRREEAQKVTLPVVVNGTLAGSAERDYFAFTVKKGERITFNLKAFRLNEQSQTFFNPALYLYDAQGKVVAKNEGHFAFDPLIDWTAPGDGTYTVLVRDLLWRGSPASVYRLAIGPLPYDTVLFPAAARPGASLSATMSGGFGAPQPVSLTVPAGAQGVTMVSTPMGEAPLLVRDLPDGGGPIGRNGGAVPLPALFRGRITEPGQVDIYRVQVSAGTGLELYARRLGSPLRARVRVTNDRGTVFANAVAEGSDDLRLPNAFRGPGQYLIEVSAADGGAGAGHIYYLEAAGDVPDFALQVSPDNLSLGPGGTAALLVRATRRQGVRGAIMLTVRNLPPGVTASAAAIPPDDDKAVITLSVAPGASPDLRAITVEGQASEGVQTITRRAQPFEVYLINNQPRLVARSSMVMAVTDAPPDFTLALDSDTLPLAPGQELRLPVKVLRRDGFQGAVQLSVLGLPPGMTAQNVVTVGPKQIDALITLRATGQARFLEERPTPGLPPIRIVIAGASGDTTYSSPTLALVGKNTQEKTAKNP